jgi:hypothetical protein
LSVIATGGGGAMLNAVFFSVMNGMWLRAGYAVPCAAGDSESDGRVWKHRWQWRVPPRWRGVGGASYSIGYLLAAVAARTYRCRGWRAMFSGGRHSALLAFYIPSA